MSFECRCCKKGIILWKKEKLIIDYKYFHTEPTSLVKLSNFGEILGDAIKKSISTILVIGGFVVFFSIILSMLETSGSFDSEVSAIDFAKRMKLGWNLGDSLDAFSDPKYFTKEECAIQAPASEVFWGEVYTTKEIIYFPKIKSGFDEIDIIVSISSFSAECCLIVFPHFSHFMFLLSFCLAR